MAILIQKLVSCSNCLNVCLSIRLPLLDRFTKVHTPFGMIRKHYICFFFSNASIRHHEKTYYTILMPMMMMTIIMLIMSIESN